MNSLRTYIFLMVVCFVASCTSKNSTVDLFVSPEKQSNADGSRSHPFSNIEEAIQKAAQFRSEGSESPITITLLPGDYYLLKPISITPELSGLTLKGTDASEVRLKGSLPLALNWERFEGDIYVAEVHDDADFDQFVVDDVPQVLARYPNYNEESGYWQGYAKDAISKKRLASWKKPEGAYFHALHSGRWGGFHFRITGINDDGTPILEGGHQNNRMSEPHEEYRMVENVFEELDSPGEWFLDHDEDQLYYWPTEDIDLGNARFEGSLLKSLVEVTGTMENPVRNVTLSDITFENTKRTFMDEFEPLLRSDWTIYRGGALFFEGTEGCTVQGCELTDLGGNAIMASKYNRELQIRENHIHDCGASAVSFVGDPSAVRSPSFNYGESVPVEEMDTIPGPQNELYPKDCLVEDNLIYRIGRLEKQVAGVQISMAMQITVRHNSIYDVPRAGINIGDGTWGGHVLEYNDVFNTVLETSDHGSFNSWGRDRFWHPNRSVMDSLTTARPTMYTWDAMHTTIIRNNRFRCDHGWDIDLDDGSSNYHIYNNLCLNNGIKLREGFNRVVKNNILVNNSLHPHVWFTHSEDVFKHNIVGEAYQDVRLLGWGKELDYNFFPNRESMMKSQIYDRDMHSAFGDPLFENPAKLDFSVAQNSPALAIGFVNFPMDRFGVQTPELKSIAKTPDVPTIKNASENDTAGGKTVPWLRNKLKSVDSKQEQSAYGLNTPEGVIVLEVWNQSPAVEGNGLKKGDVILRAEGQKIKNLQDYFAVNQKHNTAGKLKLVIMRNQFEQEITINTKDK